MYSNQETGRSTTESSQRNKKEKDTEVRREIHYNENEKITKEPSETKGWLVLFFRLNKPCGKIFRLNKPCGKYYKQLSTKTS